MKVVLKSNVLEQLQQLKNMTDQEFADFIGISRSQLWRARLNPADRRFSLGQDFIAKIMRAFPEMTFEDLFFLNHVSHACSKSDGLDSVGVGI